MLVSRRRQAWPPTRTVAEKMRALLLAVASAAACPNGPSLYFSQFQEASSGTKKYFQIYNPTAAAISRDGVIRAGEEGPAAAALEPIPIRLGLARGESLLPTLPLPLGKKGFAARPVSCKN